MQSLFEFAQDQNSVQGNGFVARVIKKKSADEYIKSKHYSGSVVWSSSQHFGIFIDDELKGCLQFGVAMNPASGDKICKAKPWLELNRMAYELPSTIKGTQVISACLKLLKKRRPDVRWIQSFADERCGKLGGIYQAASFLYLGKHLSTFYKIDDEWFHKSMKGRKKIDKRGWGCGPKISFFLENQDRAVKHEFYQYRYFKALYRGVKNKLVMPTKDYPKQ